MKLSQKYFAFAATILLGGVAATSVHAAPINLSQGYPDVFADLGQATYTVSNHTLTLTGTAENVNITSSTSTPITSGTFTATVVLTPTGGSGSTETFSVASGSLAVSGSSGSLLASLVPTQFGFSTATDDFQILFSTGTGADVGPTKQIAVSYHAEGGVANYTTNFFDSNFSTSSVVKLGTADIFAVPEPASLAILGLAVPLFLRRRRQA